MSLGVRSFTWTDLPEEIKVGNYSSIASDCQFHQADNHYCAENHDYVSTFSFKHAKSRGPIEIGNDVWIGKGVIFMDGVKVGDGAIVGAHTVVSKDVPPYAVFVGNPGRVVKFRFDPRTVRRLLKIRWFDWDEETINKRLEDLENIKDFIKKYD